MKKNIHGSVSHASRCGGSLEFLPINPDTPLHYRCAGCLKIFFIGPTGGLEECLQPADHEMAVKLMERLKLKRQLPPPPLGPSRRGARAKSLTKNSEYCRLYYRRHRQTILEKAKQKRKIAKIT